jgi:hypothetical protein
VGLATEVTTFAGLYKTTTMYLAIDNTKGTDSFNAYLAKYRDEVRRESSAEYYHVDVVAEAYQQGYTEGKKSGTKDVVNEIFQKHLEHFKQKSNQVYILTNRFISFLRERGYSAHSFYLDVNPICPKVIIAIPENHLIDDEFIEFAYKKVNELRNVFVELFSKNLDMSLVGSDNLDENSLKDDGFGYSEILDLKDEE